MVIKTKPTQKCKVMHVGYSHIVAEYVLCNNSGEHVKLTEVDQEKDLGVCIFALL